MRTVAREATSSVVCQGEGGGEALVAILVHEDGEQDAVINAAEYPLLPLTENLIPAGSGVAS